MHLPDKPVPVGTLIPVALHQIGAMLSIVPTDYPGEIIFDGTCPDPYCVPHQHRHIRKIHGKLPVRIDRFGGVQVASEHCPGSSPGERESLLWAVKFAVQGLKAHVGSLGVHGEHCGYCQHFGITVAQRIWLGIDARNVIKQRSVDEQWLPGGDVGIFTTYHRRYLKNGAEHQKTRRIDHRHPIFTELPLRQVMQMTDHDVLNIIRPELIELVAS